METIQYELKSRPGLNVEVPAEYAGKAETLIELAINALGSLKDKISEHPYLRNPGILDRTARLANLNPQLQKSVVMEDIVYLRVCIYGNVEKMRSEDEAERKQARQIDRNLVELVGELEEGAL